MNNDITALAQREKFESWLEGAEALPWGYLKKRRTSDDAYREPNTTDMWAAWQAASAEMVEALEKAQQTEKTIKSRNRRLEGIISVAENRIAEMESRTVTVKLPDSFYPDGDIELPLVMNEYQVIEALVAAGCKPVAVCPRCKRELDLSVKHDGAHYCHSAAGIQVIEGEA